MCYLCHACTGFFHSTTIKEKSGGLLYGKHLCSFLREQNSKLVIGPLMQTTWINPWFKWVAPAMREGNHRGHSKNQMNEEYSYWPCTENVTYASPSKFYSYAFAIMINRLCILINAMGWRRNQEYSPLASQEPDKKCSARHQTIVLRDV